MLASAQASTNESHGKLKRYRLLEQGDAALNFYKIVLPDPTTEPSS